MSKAKSSGYYAHHKVIIGVCHKVCMWFIAKRIIGRKKGSWVLGRERPGAVLWKRRTQKVPWGSAEIIWERRGILGRKRILWANQRIHSHPSSASIQNSPGTGIGVKKCPLLGLQDWDPLLRRLQWKKKRFWNQTTEQVVPRIDICIKLDNILWKLMPSLECPETWRPE